MYVTDVPTCISQIRCASSPVRRLDGLMTGYVGMLVCWYVGILVCWTRSETLAGLGAVAVVEEWATERDRYTPWLHRAVQGRVAGPSVQLRFISLISRSSADQQSVS